ncbi:MAG: TolC family protein [Akkermansiaceae bacterium]|nr:TolC family protein [Akkermansiaceae bacterium]
MKPIILLSFTSLIMMSCGVSPQLRQEKMSLPADWKNAGGFPVASPSRDLSRWWKRFEDPTLSKIISTAIANSPDVAAAAARIRESRARRNAQAASLFPALSGSVSSSGNASKREGFDGDSNSSQAANLNASWEVDLFGKNRSSLEAASAQLGVSQENFHSVQSALTSEIAIAYTNLRVAEAELDVLRRIVKTRSETSQLAGWRNQAGETDTLESSQASSSLEQARAGIPSLEQAIAQTKNLLALLSGKEPGGLDRLLSSGRKSIPNPAQSLAVGIPANTLRQRPDVRIAGYQLLAAAANSRAAKAEPVSIAQSLWHTRPECTKHRKVIQSRIRQCWDNRRAFRTDL